MVRNSIITAHWNNFETLSQNYDRMGLVCKLNRPSNIRVQATKSLPIKPSQPLSIPTSTNGATQVTEAHVTRDPETGAIVSVLGVDGIEQHHNNPLQDPLNELDDSDPETLTLSCAANAITGDRFAVEGEDNGCTTEATQVIREIESYSSRGVAPTQRKPSSRESQWIERLIEKHGNDYSRMSMDLKLNPMQQSTGDIRRRIRRYNQTIQLDGKG